MKGDERNFTVRRNRDSHEAAENGGNVLVARNESYFPMNVPAHGEGGALAYNLIKCCQYPILPIISSNNQSGTGNIGTGNISTLATFSMLFP